MNARVIFINEKELRSTSGNYALAGSACCEQRDEAYINLTDLINFIQTSQNATAEEMIQAQESNSEEIGGNPIAFRQEWRTYNWILSELKACQPRVL